MAALEAFEEAGLVGDVSCERLGEFHYEKRLDSGKLRRCRVDVYPMEVSETLQEWPESGERERCWMSPGQAAIAVSEGGLAEILLSFGVRFI